MKKEVLKILNTRLDGAIAHIEEQKGRKTFSKKEDNLKRTYLLGANVQKALLEELIREVNQLKEK